MQELSIKVPAPFAGVTDLGFTVQYPDQRPYAPLRDVPLVLEGPPPPMRRLAERLQTLAGTPAHSWSQPVMLSDEVVLMAFRDRSLEGGSLADGARAAAAYALNLVTPVVFPFLEDCVRLARLRLSDEIRLQIHAGQGTVAEFRLRQEEIVQPNGEVLLW